LSGADPTAYDCTALDVNSDLNDVVNTLNNGLAAGEMFIVDDGRIEPKYSFNNVSTQVYATQDAVNGDNNTVSVRILALVNSLGYDWAGVNLYAVGSDEAGIVEETNIVYSGVKNVKKDKTEETLYAPYGTYYLPITVKGIEKEGTYTFVVETYVKKDKVETLSEKYTITITNGEVVSAKKN
jgi:hypothetical protein